MFTIWRCSLYRVYTTYVYGEFTVLYYKKGARAIYPSISPVKGTHTHTSDGRRVVMYGSEREAGAVRRISINACSDYYYWMATTATTAAPPTLKFLSRRAPLGWVPLVQAPSTLILRLLLSPFPIPHTCAMLLERALSLLVQLAGIVLVQ